MRSAAALLAAGCASDDDGTTSILADDLPTTASRIAAGIAAGLDDAGDGDPAPAAGGDPPPAVGGDTGGDAEGDTDGDAAGDPPATLGAACDPHATAPASTRAQAGPAPSLRAPYLTNVPFGWIADDWTPSTAPGFPFFI